jgi:hypothetical protein
MHNSNPIKHAALAGKARNITGTTPLYKAIGPSSFIKTLNTSRIPLGNVPSGAKTNIIFQFKQPPQKISSSPGTS